MKRGFLLLPALGLFTLWSCSSDPTNDTKANVSTADGGESPSNTPAEGEKQGAPCTHPGAGPSIGTDRCACTTTHNIAGDWASRRTCREGDLCPTRDKEEQIVFTQDGTTIRAQRGDNYAIEGKLCGDVLVWSGGPKDGLNPECGTLRFTDDSHYTSDSCFAATGECVRNHGDGCPSQKGQCTGTGARMPETAAQIQKLICTK